MKENNSKTIAFKQREEHHISKYKFKANEYGKIDFKVIPYPKYKKVLRNGRKFIKFKNIFIILLIILISSAYFFLTNKRLSHLKSLILYLYQMIGQYLILILIPILKL